MKNSNVEYLLNFRAVWQRSGLTKTFEHALFNTIYNVVNCL